MIISRQRQGSDLFPEVLVFRSIWSHRPYRLAFPVLAVLVSIAYALVIPLLPIYLFGASTVSGGAVPVPALGATQVLFALGMGVFLPAVILGDLGLRRSATLRRGPRTSSEQVSGKVAGAMVTSLVPSLASTLVGCTSSLTVAFAAAGAATLAPTLGHFLGTYAWAFYTLTFVILWYSLRRLGRLWGSLERQGPEEVSAALS